MNILFCFNQNTKLTKCLISTFSCVSTCVSLLNQIMKFTIKSDLLELFRLVGAKGEEFSVAELMTYLKEYIKLKRLYDPRDPVIIDVQNDPLGKIFNSNRFSVLKAQSLLFTCLRPARDFHKREEKLDYGDTDKKDENRNKRKDHDFDSDELKQKRFLSLPNASPIYIDVYSGPEYDSSPETVLSIQGYETTFAKDSSDESLTYGDDDDITEPINECESLLQSTINHSDFNSLASSDEDLSSFISDNDLPFEYEVSSVLSSQNTDSDSGDDVVAELFQLISEPEETDLEFWADSSNCEDVTSDDFDPDITDCDKWLCKHCSCRNWPTMRFCQKCWQLRHNWLPDQRRRPPKRLRRKRKRQEGTRICRKLTNYTSELPRPGTSAAGISVVVEEHIAAPYPRNEDGTKTTSESKSLLDFGMDSPEKCDNEETSETINSSQASTDSGSCIICSQRPRNACFVHGSSAHMISCFHCARKLWQQGKPCPACRRNIQKIIRVYMS